MSFEEASLILLCLVLCVVIIAFTLTCCVTTQLQIIIEKLEERISGEERSGEEKSGEEKSGEERSGEERSGEEKSGEEKSGKEKSGEERSGEEKESNEEKKRLETIKQKECAEEEILKRLTTEIEQRDGKKVTCMALMCSEINYNHIHRLIKKFTRDNIENNIYIILHVLVGGDVSDCTILSNILLKKLKENPDLKISMFVPEIALSSGTQIALHSTELIMGKFAHLGAIDDQLRGIGVKHVKTIMKQWKCKKQDFSLKEHDIIQQSQYMYNITLKELETILELQHYTKKEIQQIRKLFLDHERYHSYPITFEEAKENGLRVKELTDELILNAFYDLYNIWFNIET